MKRLATPEASFVLITIGVCVIIIFVQILFAIF